MNSFLDLPLLAIYRVVGLNPKSYRVIRALDVDFQDHLAMMKIQALARIGR